MASSDALHVLRTPDELAGPRCCARRSGSARVYAALSSLWLNL